MKLINFQNDKTLNTLRIKLNASYSSIDWSSQWKPFSADEILAKLKSSEGLEVDFDSVTICDDNTFEYAGEKVLVYIRDQYLRYDQEIEYKFHMSNCISIKKARRDKGNTRYVISSRVDGIFTVNLINSQKNVVVEKDKKQKLNVCRNCLSNIKYKNYTSKKNHIYNKFSLEEFFKLYPGRNDLIRQRYRNDHTANINLYPKDFKKIADALKKQRGYKCQQCKLDMADKKEFLDAHHVDRDKSNNNPDNLKLLCVRCHSDQPSHSHMKTDSRYKEFIFQ